MSDFPGETASDPEKQVDVTRMGGARYFLARDQSAHWYIVPLDQAAVWEEWAEIPEDDERSWTPPASAKMIDIYRLTFSFPMENRQ